MESVFIDNWNKQLKKGILIFLIMNIIQKKPCYGHEIIKKIKESTGIQLKDGTLYPILKQLKKENFVVTRWDVNDERAPRKYYYLTGMGNTTLNSMDQQWKRIIKSIDNMIT